jgi:hypothetical protein
MTVTLGYQKVCSHWVPCLLTDEYKEDMHGCHHTSFSDTLSRKMISYSTPWLVPPFWSRNEITSARNGITWHLLPPPKKVQIHRNYLLRCWGMHSG